MNEIILIIAGLVGVLILAYLVFKFIIWVMHQGEMP